MNLYTKHIMKISRISPFIKYSFIMLIALMLNLNIHSQNIKEGLRGDHDAILDAKAMVERMGGIEIWSQLESLHFVHEWYPWNRVDSYIENEILDLTGSRSWVERRSEINLRMRVYSPEGKHWSIRNGEFSYASKERTEASQTRAPFNFYRLVKGVADGNSFFEVKYGTGDIPGTKRLEFYGPDNIMRGWIILNMKHEPIVKATNSYRYTLGPLKKYGNILVPEWGVYDNGYTRYNMISLIGDNHAPDLSIFLPKELANKE